MSVNNFAPVIPEMYLINRKLQADNPISDGKIIKDLIAKDLVREEKQRMQEGVNYYNIKHDILYRKQSYFNGEGVKVEDKTKSNHKCIYPFSTILIDQKVQYLVGKPVKFSVDNNKSFADVLNEYLDDNFNEILCELIKEVSKKGKEWLHIFINEQGEFDYMICDSRGIIPIYDTKTCKQLESLIRYSTIYVVGADGKEQARYAVEWYDSEKCTYYVQTEQNSYVLDDRYPVNPSFHWYSYNTSNPDAVTASTWGKVPFIKFKNNEEETSDLLKIKALIDVVDINVSDFSNNHADIQDIIWKLKDYEGEDLSEFLTNLKVRKVISVGESGDAEPITTEIPYQSRIEMMKELKEAIFMFGQGVDMSVDKMGNAASGISLKFLYGLLDLKCDTLERKTKVALREFLSFLLKWVNLQGKGEFDPKEVKITFNRNMIINTSEMIDGVQKSNGILSKKTLLENHPYVDDADEELERLDDEASGINLEGGGNVADIGGTISDTGQYNGQNANINGKGIGKGL